MIELLGWIATVIVIINMTLLNIRKTHIKIYFHIVLLSASLFSIYAALQQDLPFLIVNSYIGICAMIKTNKEDDI